MKENFMINDAEIASFSLNDMITGFDEDTSAYTHLPAKNPYPHFCFALNIGMTVEEVIEALKNYLSELERGECREVVSIEKKMIEKEYWTKGGMLRHNLLAMRERLEHNKVIMKILKAQRIATIDEFINRIEESYAEVARLLSEIRQRVMNMTRHMYGKFYQYMKSQHDAEPATMAYDEWMMKEGDYSFETLKGRQTWEVAEFLRKNLLRHLRTPVQSEIDKVDVDKVIYWMPCDYDREYLMSDDFRIQCAKFHRFCSWEGDVLKLNYEALGKYLFQNYYKMTEEERQAFFNLDIMVEQINRDIAKVMPETKEEEDSEQQTEDTEGTMELAIGDAVSKMWAEGTLKNLYDYTWVMMVMNETEWLPSFDTPTSFMNYMRKCGVMSMPSLSNITKYYEKARGEFPNWTFLGADGTETKRRNNVGKRFLNLMRCLNNSH